MYNVCMHHLIFGTASVKFAGIRGLELHPPALSVVLVDVCEEAKVESEVVALSFIIEHPLFW